MPVTSITGRPAIVAVNVSEFKLHTFITLAHDSYTLSRHQMLARAEQAREWCGENCKGEWFVQVGRSGVPDDFAYYLVGSFNTEDDALRFRLCIE